MREMKELEDMSIKELNLIIGEVQSRIRMLQASCTHEHITYNRGSCSDQYAPDVYWIKFTCLDCGCSNTFDSDEEGYSLTGIGTKLKCTEEEYEVLCKFGKGV